MTLPQLFQDNSLTLLYHVLLKNGAKNGEANVRRELFLGGSVIAGTNVTCLPGGNLSARVFRGGIFLGGRGRGNVNVGFRHLITDRSHINNEQRTISRYIRGRMRLLWGLCGVNSCDATVRVLTTCLTVTLLRAQNCFSALRPRLTPDFTIGLVVHSTYAHEVGMNGIRALRG